MQNAHSQHISDLLEAAKALLANAKFADGQGIILTHDAEDLEAAIAKVGEQSHG